jgi:hypothetical protein
MHAIGKEQRSKCGRNGVGMYLCTQQLLPIHFTTHKQKKRGLYEHEIVGPTVGHGAERIATRINSQWDHGKRKYAE